MSGQDWTNSGLEVLGPNDFESGRLRRPGRYAVCFGAAWCPFCRAFVETFRSMPTREDTHRAIADITDLKSPLWDSFHIRITPSVVCFENGAQVLRLDGRRFRGIRGRQLEPLAEFLR